MASCRFASAGWTCQAPGQLEWEDRNQAKPVLPRMRGAARYLTTVPVPDRALLCGTLFQKRDEHVGGGWSFEGVDRLDLPHQLMTCVRAGLQSTVNC